MTDHLTRRFFAFAVDSVIISFAAMLTFFVYSVFLHDDRNGFEIFRVLPYLFFCGFALLKDAFGRSLGKMLLRLRIEPECPGEKLMLPRRIARNVTLLVWPVEAAILIITGRRLSDKLLGLRVVGAGAEDTPTY